MYWGVTLEMHPYVSYPSVLCGAGINTHTCDVKLFNVDLFGRAMLGDHAINVQQLWVELGSTPMRAKAEKPLHNWAGQLLVRLLFFFFFFLGGVGGLSATR